MGTGGDPVKGRSRGPSTLTGSPHPNAAAFRHGDPDSAGSDASNEHFKLLYYDPPAGLEKHILTLFDLHWNEEFIEDRHIGAMGQLFLVVEGQGFAKFGERRDDVKVGSIVFNAFEVSVPFQLKGPWRCVGASFSPYGWASLMQDSVKDHGNSFLPANRLLGKQIDDFSGTVIERLRSEEITGLEACHEVAEWVRARLKPIPDGHEEVIDIVLGWLGTSLNPKVDVLYGNLDYSRRQVERLVLRYFGLSPAALARKFRAVRSANLLAQSDLSDEGAAEIADAFFDQPHMIKEIQRFCGYTPARLGGEGVPMFHRLTHIQNLERMKLYRIIGQDDAD